MNSNLLLFDIARVRSSRGWRARHHPILAAMATKGSFLNFDVWLVLLLWLDPLCLTIVFLLFSSVQIQIFSLKHMVFLNFFTDLQGSPMLRPGGSLPTEWPWCWQLSWEFLNHGVSTVSLATCDMCHHEVVSLAKKPAEKAKATAVKASLTFASSIRKSPIQMFLVADCFCPNVLLPGFFMWHRKHTWKKSVYFLDNSFSTCWNQVGIQCVCCLHHILLTTKSKHQVQNESVTDKRVLNASRRENLETLEGYILHVGLPKFDGCLSANSWCQAPPAKAGALPTLSSNLLTSWFYMKKSTFKSMACHATRQTLKPGCR